MIGFLAVIGTILFLLGVCFGWLNMTTPYQTCLPVPLGGAGLIMILLALGGWLL